MAEQDSIFSATMRELQRKEGEKKEDVDIDLYTEAMSPLISPEMQGGRTDSLTKLFKDNNKQVRGEVT